MKGDSAEITQEQQMKDEFQTPEPNRESLELDGKKALSVDAFLNRRDSSLSDKIAFCENVKPSFDGGIELILGPMFAGKSTELLRRVQRHAISGKSCLYVKYAFDTRYDVNCIATHDDLKKEATAVQMLSELGDKWRSFDVIGIDEGQFYKDVVEFSENAAQAGKIVVISSLNGTYEQKPFNDVLDLVPKAEKIKHLAAICKICYNPAPFTLRLQGVQGGDELIGGSDMYMPVCRECHTFKMNQQKSRLEALETSNKNEMHVIKFSADEEDGDDCKLLSIQKSSSSSKHTQESSLQGSSQKPGSLLDSPATMESPESFKQST